MLSEANYETFRRPPAICCPECGQIVKLIEKACNYPCERCGVLWRWYYRPGMRDDVDVIKERYTPGIGNGSPSQTP